MFKKILSLCVAVSLAIPTLGGVENAMAASGGATKFQITAPATAIAGEAFDITVTAIDANGNKATGYTNSVIFNTETIGDTYPMIGKTVPFTAEDAGEKKFAKGVSFKRAGKQKLYVSDVKEDIYGEVIITVEPAGTSTVATGSEISILTPTMDSKITTDMVLVSGTARKNSKVSIEFNGQNVGTVISDAEGLFTKEVQGITQENNILKASLIDATDAVIATSSEVKFAKTTETSSLYGLSIAPGTSVESSTEITLTIDAVKGLSEVTAMLDGSLLKATESSEGKYTIKTPAPQKEGEYPIDVTAKSITGQETKKEKLATLTVTAKKEEPKEEPKAEEPKEEVKNPAFKDVKTETKDSRVTFTFAVENAPADLDAFEISHASGSVTTYSGSKILKDGKYSWYIDKLTPGQYTFKIQGKNASGALMENLVSEPLMATIGVQQCTVSNVGEISIKTDTSKSILTWPAVQNAMGYNVYKIGTDGKYTLVTKVKDPSYTVFLSQGAVTYGDFAVKALCDDKTESADFTRASKVQTGPGMIAFIVIVSAILGFAVLRRKNS